MRGRHCELHFLIQNARPSSHSAWPGCFGRAVLAERRERRPSACIGLGDARADMGHVLFRAGTAYPAPRTSVLYRRRHRDSD